MHPADRMDWNQLRTFVTVAHAGSLAAAARQLGLAHPTVARHIQQLEATLGQDLFDRKSTGLALNAAGSALAEAAQPMVAGARAFVDASAANIGSTSGVVRITASEFLADVFPELLVPLRSAGQGQQVNVDFLVANQQLNLLESDADIAIRHFQPQQQELVCRRLQGLPFGLFASASYIAEKGEPQVGNMGEHWYIDAVTTPRFAKAAQRMGYELQAQQFVFRSDSLTGQVNGALAGWGIVGLPLHIAAAHGALRRVLPQIPVSEIEMWLVGRPNVRTTRYLKDAFGLVAETLNQFVRGL